MTTIIRDFRELRVYRRAFGAAMSIFHLSKAWPPEERFSMTDQIRRCSRSVAANIAEAWRKRRYPANFVSKLSDAEAEAGETIVWLEFAQASGYLSAEDYKRLADDFDHICGALVKMRTQARTWCSV